MRDHYAGLFRGSPKLLCELVNRIGMGRYVFDQERVTGRMNQDGEIRVVAVYEVVGNLISKVWFARP